MTTGTLTAHTPERPLEQAVSRAASNGLELSSLAFYDHNPHSSRPDRAAGITTPVMR